MLAYTALAALALGLRVSAQSIPAVASAEELALVGAQFANSGFNLTTNAGFGLDLDAKALLTVVYGFGAVENGQEYSVEQVTNAPEIYVTPAQDTAAWFNSSSRYTLTLADASALGDPDSEGNYRHFLANSETGAAASGNNLTFSPQDGTVITSYAAPGPLAGSGTHRYAWLLFAQPENFSAPSGLSTAGTAPSHWSVSSYVEQTGLQLVAASFFTVQPNGNPTGSVATTEAVNTATLAVSSASSTGSASHSDSKSGAHSSTSSGAQPSATGGSGNGAASLSASVAAGLLGVAGVVVAAL
ncbi:YbhB/YbcL family Raf kinase inhibitor-like protein [Sporobolomyces koalae]|uniref:YbhB/YbcL family Raf kinase inhibitor-like protein n=1 Tax=Sporobolomyces koalae TaxID=500713 RepID=UPI0031750726